MSRWGSVRAGRAQARVAGAILVALALLTLAQDGSGALMAALMGGARLDPVARHVWIADLALNAPAVLVGGVLLWRRSPLGYLVGAGLLLQYGLTPTWFIVVGWKLYRLGWGSGGNARSRLAQPQQIDARVAP